MERNTFALFYRLVFFVISCTAAMTYEFSVTTSNSLDALLVGFSKGMLLFLLLIGCEAGFKRISLRSFNTTLVGIAVGMLMGFVVSSCIQVIFSALGASPSSEIRSFVVLFIYLTALYMGIRATYSAAEVWWLSIPFVQLAPAGQSKKNEILLDLSAIEDSRLIDLARLGLLDHQLILASFVLKEIQKGMESADEIVKARYRKCLEYVKRLENMPTLGLQYKEFHTSELDDLPTKLLRTAKLLQAYIMTSEQGSFKQSEEEEVVIISIEAIANAIKPSAQRGEILSIKVQRPGKEPKQGVGYLDDGTMVVVNGGGDFLGETIKTQVLSQKYSSSGKIIFCNALYDEKIPIRFPQASDDMSPSASPYAMAGVQERRDDLYAAPLARSRKDPQHERASYDPWNRH